MTFFSKSLVLGVSLTLLLLGCTGDSSPLTQECGCTAEFRFNICVTVNGSPALPDSLTFVRQRTGGLDTILYRPDNHCFGEYVGSQRVFMLRNGTKLDSSALFVTKTVDCCHGEAHTVNFTR